MEARIHGMITVAGYHRLPDLLAVRQFRPRQHHLILTPRTQRLQEFLIEQSKPFCDFVEVIEIDAFKPFQIYRVCQRLSQQYAPGDMVLNLAGGTKPLMLLAYEAARAHNHKILFYDPFKRAFTLLYPEVQPLRLSFSLDLEETLNILGYRILEKRSEEENKRFKQWALRIGKNINDYLRLLIEMNKYFRENPDAPVDSFEPPWQPTVFELELLEESKMWVPEQPAEKVRDFLAGGWMKDYLLWASRSYLEEVIADALLEHIEWGAQYYIPVLAIRQHTLFSFWYLWSDDPIKIRDTLVEIRKWTKTVGQGISKNYLFTLLDPYQHKQLLFMARRMHIFLLNIRDFPHMARVLRVRGFTPNEVEL